MSRRKEVWHTDVCNVSIQAGQEAYCPRCNMYNDGIRRLIENIKRQHKAWNRIIQSSEQTIQRMNAQMEPYWRMAEQMQKQVQAALRASEPLRQYIAKMQASLAPMRGMVRRLIEQRQAFKENYRKAQDYLFNEGWYLGSDMPFPNYKNLAKMVDAGEHAEIEEAMCGWARTQVEMIIKSAAKEFPVRARVLEDAAEAHLAGKYTLSIPVFLAQSDGMANNIIGNCLFRGDAPKALEKTLAQFDGFPLSDLSDILLDPLREHSSFYTCSTKQAAKSGVKLANRSEVMHGAQLDYASEANSLRGIVLLAYLVGVKSLLESHEERVRRIMNEALESGDDLPDAEQSNG